MVTILKYKIIVIVHDIYIKVFSDRTVSYITVSTDNVLNTTNNETEFPELIIFFEEDYSRETQDRKSVVFHDYKV